MGAVRLPKILALTFDDFVSAQHTWMGTGKRPLPFDVNYNPKPAYYELLATLQHHPRTRQTRPAAPGAGTSTSGAGGSARGPSYT